jgi:hypothetical protein
MLAIDGTPVELSVNIMYLPGGARFGFTGAIAVNPVFLFWNQSHGSQIAIRSGE